jgi:hypothetical protein
MADNDKCLERDACALNAKLQSSRVSHAFSIEKLLSVTSSAASEICFGITSEPAIFGEAGDSQQGVAENHQQGVPEEDDTLQYTHCSYGRTSIVSADSSSVGLPPRRCSDCDEDGDDLDDLTVQSSPGVTEGGAVVSTTLSDGEGLNHGPHSGEFNSSSENVAKSPYLKDKGK